jgi:hypothetical protein
MKRTLAMLALTAAWGGMMLGVLTAAEPEKTATKPASTKPAASKPTTKPTSNPVALRGAYMQMNKVLHFTDEQIAKILDLETQHERAAADWKAANGSKLTAADEALAKAKEAQTALDAERKAIDAKFSKLTMDVVTDEQKAQWREFNVVKAVKDRLGKTALTDAQDQKLRAGYVEQSKGLDLSDDKIRAEFTGRLAGWVEKEVLTDAQREVTKKPAAPTPTSKPA